VEPADVVDGFPQGGEKFRVHPGMKLPHLLLGNRRERIELHPVEPSGVLDHRRVAPPADILDDRPYRGLDLGGKREFPDENRPELRITLHFGIRDNGYHGKDLRKKWTMHNEQ
jgi:hypothetical protein